MKSAEYSKYANLSRALQARVPSSLGSRLLIPGVNHKGRILSNAAFVISQAPTWALEFLPIATRRGGSRSGLNAATRE